eukprot:4521411-Lingulodinium_polyedra.AAC.1
METSASSRGAAAPGQLTAASRCRCRARTRSCARGFVGWQVGFLSRGSVSPRTQTEGCVGVVDGQ